MPMTMLLLGIPLEGTRTLGVVVLMLLLLLLVLDLTHR